jgi:ABC-type polysaccharide/polyol phosphate transport system ATPase subunit
LRGGEFWAVKDVSFTLQRGDSLALIGFNGAGKSTLLKVLNGIIRPDEGSVRMRGRVGALIEVGAGFHPMLTGRENIYLNGAILGMSTREVERKFEQIVEFSGLDADILDAPVKTYSSGMYVRLGFAVAVHTEPDILLVDEVLAVGDARFTGRCGKKIKELRQRGTSLILVSHSLSLIEQTCDRGMVLSQGQTLFDGSVNAAISAYRSCVQEAAPPRLDTQGAAGIAESALRLISGQVQGEEGDYTNTLRCGEVAALRLMIATEAPIASGILSVWLHRLDDQQITGIGYLEVGRDLPPLHTGELEIRWRCQVVPGEYKLGVTFSTDGEYGIVDEFTACRLSVEPSARRRNPSVGIYMLDTWCEGLSEASSPPAAALIPAEGAR